MCVRISAEPLLRRDHLQTRGWGRHASQCPKLIAACELQAPPEKASLLDPKWRESPCNGSVRMWGCPLARRHAGSLKSSPPAPRRRPLAVFGCSASSEPDRKFRSLGLQRLFFGGAELFSKYELRIGDFLKLSPGHNNHFLPFPLFPPLRAASEALAPHVGCDCFRIVVIPLH